MSVMVSRAERGRIRLQVRGALLAAACGFALGRAADQAAASVEDFDSYSRAGDPLPATGEVTLMRAHAACLFVAGEDRLSQRALAATWAALWQRQPDAQDADTGPGEATIGHQRPWWHNSREPSTVAAAMRSPSVRVVPAGLVQADLSRIAAYARAAAAITHTDRRVHEDAAVIACAVALALRTTPTGRQVDAFHFTHQLASHTTDLVLADRLTRVAAIDATTRMENVAVSLAEGANGVRPVVAAVAAFLRHHDDPAAAITFAVRTGAAASQAGGIAGAITAARTGGGALPAAWLRRIHDRERLCDLADRVATTHLAS